MKKLENRVAIITGGARGMGATHARLFIEEGAKVVITDILEHEGEKLALELGPGCFFIKHDVTDEVVWQKVVNETENRFGPVNILINNAGISFNKQFEDTTLQEFERVMKINATGTFLGMKAVLPSMRKTKKGSIVNISSIAGMVGFQNTLAYVSSKYAVRGMTKAAALELAAEGIRVNSIHPGLIETPMIMNEEMEAMISTIAEGIPMKRTAKPEEISRLALFLASDDSSYCTGSEFIADGGLIAQ
ncbi:MAG: glucose 1-dehydrogenase [Bacteroidales bacterium]|jgi:3alpha(or 20beta)-hydroxysteroid dehydrogenase|nr:glucose 1-dehydrogenase [Bacteroidales bacterium]MDD2426135.1 glucose 1-dehydrogenase [Bacteroidales bacterium]MDD3989474.1 glucose 1-dehydrogenase [Bacteroidales bacterium]MDD4639192.1 glucose 1-dehydrogenase [Bacteroidales bacterium]